MLSDDLKTLYGTTFVLFMKTFGFHHNVEGENFPQYHEFLGDMYSDIYESLDKIAEYIRTLDSYAPGSLSRMIELSELEEQSKIPRAELMFAELIEDSVKYIEMLKATLKSAQENTEEGIANFMAERQDAMAKHLWMMRSIMKRQRA